MKNLTILFLLAIGTFMSSCTNAQNDNSGEVAGQEIIKSVNVVEFKKLINEKAGVLVDVRTPGENAAGNIPGSKLMNINDSNFAKNIESLDKNVPVLVYCRSGARSMSAARILKSKGFTSVYNLNGGFKAWSASQR